ncbi:MAG: type I-C CRISPR-associated endonuclease Cas1c [Candidatus Brocadiia bacterium]
MKRLLNTIFVTTRGAYLSRKGETVVVRADGETQLRFPIHNLGGIVCFGEVSCSSPLVQLCSEKDVTISFLSKTGQYFGRIQGPVSGNVLLRREQYRLADKPDVSGNIARTAVIGKIANSRTVLQRASRDHPEKVNQEALDEAVGKIRWALRGLDGDVSLDEIRGREGEAAQAYFGAFDHLITSQKDDFEFNTRNRRPPLDPVNALLSFYYTLLLHDCVSALESVGLDPAVGYLHRDRPGRPGLALDLMEEFRAFMADRLALSLINRRQLKAGDFISSETGAVKMTDTARKKVITAYQERKQQEIFHPFLEEKMETGLLPYAQALLLARMIRNDLDSYPPFVWK